MTIEQKAKAYDELIKRLKDFQSKYRFKTIEESFPELKESGDEKIKDAAIEFVRQNKSFHYSLDISKEQVLAWLEKQGKNNMGISEATKKKLEDNLNKALEKETPESLSKFLDEKGKKIELIEGFNTEFEKQVSCLIASVINKDYEYTKDFVKWASDGLLNYAKHEIEKQDKQNEDITREKIAEYLKNLILDQSQRGTPMLYYEGRIEEEADFIISIAKKELKNEKQGEQKPVDKVELKDYNSIDPYFGKPIDNIEPKFRNGQWIVWQDKYYKVNYNGCGYELVDQNGFSTSLEYGTIDENAHLWDITKDAKDGDVLSYRDGQWIFIYKEKIDDSSFYYYTLYSTIHQDLTINDSAFTLLGDAIIPATKEQRDLLFRKMKEACYKWDAEHKQLDKIEQKPDEWEPQTGDTFRKKGTTSPTYHLCNKREDGITFGFVENREVGIAGGEITIFALRQDYELVERPKSIEDVVEEELNKGLQTKVEQKPAWSEEDEKMFRDLHNLIYVVRDCDCDSKEKLKLSDWIESLKGRNQSKQEREWSKEDEKCIRLSTDIIDSALRAGFCVQLDRDRCIDWLKSLKERYTWKPNKKQMHYLSWIANIKLGDSVVEQEVSKHLNELYKDLKKLMEK